MSFTVQEVRDDAKSNFGLSTSDTGSDTILLNAFNREVWPDLRGVMLLADEHYFDVVETENLVSGTDTYNTDNTLRKLWAVHVLRDSGSQFWNPLMYVPDQKQGLVQVGTATSANVWGFYMLGKSVKVVDIPRESITAGLRFSYTPELTALAITDTIASATNPLANDFAPAFICGLSLKLARLRKDKDMITVYWAEYQRLRKELQISVESRVEADMQLPSGDPIGL